jgi:hypothetical protein
MDCYFAPGYVGRNDWKGYYMDGSGIESQGKVAYEAPCVERLGFFHEETRNFCVLGKQWGGHDSFAGIVGVPISNCSA